MSQENLIGIALGVASLVIAAIIFWGGFVEVKRGTEAFAEREAGGRAAFP